MWFHEGQRDREKLQVGWEVCVCGELGVEPECGGLGSQTGSVTYPPRASVALRSQRREKGRDFQHGLDPR